MLHTLKYDKSPSPKVEKSVIDIVTLIHVPDTSYEPKSHICHLVLCELLSKLIYVLLKHILIRCKNK